MSHLVEDSMKRLSSVEITQLYASSIIDIIEERRVVEKTASHKRTLGKRHAGSMYDQSLGNWFVHPNTALRLY